MSSKHYLSNKCSVQVDQEGPRILVEKERKEILCKIGYSFEYWDHFVTILDEVNECLKAKKIRTFRDVNAKPSDADGGRRLRVEVGLFDSKTATFWHVGLHFEDNKMVRCSGGVNFSPEEFENLLNVLPSIESAVASIRGSPQSPPRKIARFSRDMTHVNDAMAESCIRAKLFRWRRSEGKWSEWKMFRRMCVDEIAAEGVNPDECEIAECSAQPHGNMVTVLELAVAGLLIFMSRERAMQTCGGCPSGCHGCAGDANYGSRSALEEDHCDERGCQAGVFLLAARHWEHVKQTINSRYVTRFCAMFMSMYGDGYSFSYDSLFACCAVLLHMSRSASLLDVPTESDFDDALLDNPDGASFVGAAAFVSKLIRE